MRAVLLGLPRLLDELWVGRQQHADHAAASRLARRPEQEVGRGESADQKLFGSVHLDRIAAAHIGGGHDQDERRGAVRVPQSELHGRERSGRSACNRKFLDVQPVKQLDESIRLSLRGGIGRKIAAQVAEAGGRDHLEAREALGECKPLVEPASGAVNHQERRPVPRVAYSSWPNSVGMTWLRPARRVSWSRMSERKLEYVRPVAAIRRPPSAKAAARLLGRLAATGRGGPKLARPTDDPALMIRSGCKRHRFKRRRCRKDERDDAAAALRAPDA